MENCLKTQLNAVVNNPNLPLFDTIKLLGFIGTTELISTTAKNADTCYAYYKNHTSQKMGQRGDQITYDACFVPVYDSQLPYNGIWTNIPEGSSLEERVILVKTASNLDRISNFFGELSDVEYFTNLKSFRTTNGVSDTNYQASGDCAVLSRLINLDTIMLKGVNVVGDLENLVEGFITNGIADKSISLDLRTDANIKIHNAYHVSAIYTLTFSQGTCTITYDNSGTTISVATYNPNATPKWTYNS